MFCPKCGAKNPDGAAFCKECGGPIGKPAAQASATDTAAPATTVAQSAAAAVAKKNRKPLIFAGIALLIIILLIIFGITMCVGGDGIRPGIYSAKTGTSDARSLIVNDDKTIGVSANGTNFVFSYSESGTQGNSIIYDLKTKTINGVEVKYNGDGYITNFNETYGSIYGLSSISNGLCRFDVQLMIPKGGTEGNVVGEWGLSIIAVSDANTANSYTSFTVTYLNVNENGTAQSFTKNDDGKNVNAPGMKPEQLIALGARETNGYWHKVSDSVFVLSESAGGNEKSDITITFPSK